MLEIRLPFRLISYWTRLVDPSGLGPSESSGKDYFAQYERPIERLTGNSKIKWEGIDSVEWSSSALDDVISLVTKKPIPSASFNYGKEYGYRIYEFETGTQLEKYTGDGYGSREVYSISPANFSGKTVWHSSPADRTIYKKSRYQLCLAGSCITY